MTAYDNFENDLIQNEEDTDEINYGTPDPNSEISKVPCGGCGALLHCKVSISPDEYPKILSIIRNKQALVVLMVDLMDFPCSIWPGIADILGPKTPIVVVGNKVDLLPRDGKKFLSRVEQNLLDHIRLSGFATSNILNVSLISAKSGFGVEALITRLHSLWKHKGDVYLVGCTNVGKSSLFNALLQSDYCKIQASDLIQRATISHWPGTTLNMLKFPIMRPTGQRLYWRHKRLMEEQRFAAKEAKLRTEVLKTDNVAAHATLIGRIGQTYSRDNDTDVEVKDCFLMSTKTNDPGNVRMGIDENHPEYALSRWCFDTPGVVQPNQILHLLTIEELMHTIPKEIIRPQTFCVKPGTSLFIAGLARLDFLKGPGSVRLTVFRSNALPVTLCHLEVADSIYEECLGTELFKVPVPSAIRLSKWPGLESTKPFVVTGAGRRTSCNDVVLSSAGWVAITPLKVGDFEFQAWTPEKRGIYIRDSLLPEAVTLKGPRISRSVAYKYNKFI
ncbi:hypothetical protein NQ315_011898 [Exocentrus adspersus]|uniref:G domain-containing protein n=1 Tax=Exocentrus adspersus TaxID=1586481 RepID=A0AAV8W0N7_9CUCU|nr:hypothetical protein NQ315_011898 [Exocentrus adspersus]